MTGDFPKQLLAEHRTDRVLEFDDARVRRMSIRHGEESHVFVRKEGQWVYEAEPDLPYGDWLFNRVTTEASDVAGSVARASFIAPRVARRTRCTSCSDVSG